MRLTKRFCLEASAAAASFATLVLTIVAPRWFEALFGIDPDQHNGLLEWTVVANLLVVFVGLTVLAGREWRNAVAG